MHQAASGVVVGATLDDGIPALRTSICGLLGYFPFSSRGASGTSVVEARMMAGMLLANATKVKAPQSSRCKDPR